MTKLIEKAREASIENLMEMAMLLNGSVAKEGAMARMAVMVALEEKIGSEAFDKFSSELEAA